MKIGDQIKTTIVKGLVVLLRCIGHDANGNPIVKMDEAITRPMALVVYSHSRGFYVKVLNAGAWDLFAGPFSTRQSAIEYLTNAGYHVRKRK